MIDHVSFRISALCVLAVAAILLTVPSPGHAQNADLRLGFDCLVVDPTGSALNVREKPRGSVIATVPRGSSVLLDRFFFPTADERGKPWAEVLTVRSGGIVKLGFAFYEYLDCAHQGRSEGNPLLFDGVQKLRTLGIDFPSFTEANRSASFFPNKCFYFGDGGPSMSLSNNVVAALRRRGISLEVACIVMRSGVVRFDPETGQRLATFIMVNRKLLQTENKHLAVSEENPLEVPDCFARGQFRQTRDRLFEAKLVSTGCEMRFDVWSGRRLSAAETQVMSAASLVVSGESAPDPGPEAIKAARKPPTSSSDAELARLARRLAGG